MFLVALNYGAYRTELFRDEYNDNHPRSVNGLSITRPTLTWETFDKDNAPQAFVLNVESPIEPLSELHAQPYAPARLFLPFQPIRDKSPPAPASPNA